MIINKFLDPNVREMDEMMSKEVIEQQIKVEDFVHQFYNEAEDQVYFLFK